MFGQNILLSGVQFFYIIYVFITLLLNVLTVLERHFETRKISNQTNNEICEKSDAYHNWNVLLVFEQKKQIGSMIETRKRFIH